VLIFSGLLLPWFGFMCGCFCAILLRQEPPDVTAIAIETGVQNTGIAIMLLKVGYFKKPIIVLLLDLIFRC
jgi:sodium/bile acid cotransporter 3/5